MLIEIKKSTTKEQIAKLLKKIKFGKSFNAQKYCGALKWNIDGIEFQKQLRNEWD